MSFAHEPVFIWMSQFAYEPTMVYFGIVAMMILSAVGLPVPEEVTLISVGILAFMGANPQLFPPPYAGAPVVNPTEAALIAAFSVFIADFLIYTIGRVWGRKLLRHRRLSKFVSPQLLAKAEDFTHKYGPLATGVFRFTPGVRFPGHLLCGMLKLPAWKFGLVDLMAVSISVPTQILLIAHYGEPILEALKKFKLVVLGAIGIGLIVFAAIKLKKYFADRELQK